MPLGLTSLPSISGYNCWWLWRPCLKIWLEILHLSGVLEVQSWGLPWRLGVMAHHIPSLEKKFLWLKSVAREISWTSHLFKFMQWMLSFYIWWIDLKVFYKVLGTEFLFLFLLFVYFSVLPNYVKEIVCTNKHRMWKFILLPKSISSHSGTSIIT